jgi:hypothetical protein
MTETCGSRDPGHHSRVSQNSLIANELGTPDRIELARSRSNYVKFGAGGIAAR